MKMLQAVLLAAIVALLLFPLLLNASDHADPIKLGTLGIGADESGITGLFVFPDGDHLVVILNVRRNLLDPPPYNFDNKEYIIHMDLDSKVTYDNAQEVARYGGTVVEPDKISAEVKINIVLTDKGRVDVRKSSYQGLNNISGIRRWAGVYDDPFIQPRFFKKNVVAMILSIPMNAFPEGQQDWLIWATSARKDKQIDHVGRANRTMLPRLDFLNTVAAAEQTAALQQRMSDPGLIDKALMEYAEPFFAIRFYDIFPDVMIYTTRRPAGFPNGRKLTDDIANLTCDNGDCLLWELSYAAKNNWPRATKNDKPFLEKFPYLAPPWTKEEIEAANN